MEPVMGSIDMLYPSVIQEASLALECKSRLPGYVSPICIHSNQSIVEYSTEMDFVNLLMCITFLELKLVYSLHSTLMQMKMAKR